MFINVLRNAQVTSHTQFFCARVNVCIFAFKIDATKTWLKYLVCLGSFARTSFKLYFSLIGYQSRIIPEDLSLLKAVGDSRDYDCDTQSPDRKNDLSSHAIEANSTEP